MRSPKAADFLSFGTTQPFVFADYGTLNATTSRQLSDQTLRDFFLPVTTAGRRDAVSKGFPLTGFRQLRDQVLTLDRGVHGVRETFDYTDNRTGNHQAEITRVMSSVTASRLVQPTGPFSTLIGR